MPNISEKEYIFDVDSKNTVGDSTSSTVFFYLQMRLYLSVKQRHNITIIINEILINYEMELCPVACGINCGINFKKETPEALKIKGSEVIVIIPTHLVLQKFVKKRCKTWASEGSKLPF